MVAFLEKSTGSAGFHQIIDFITQSHIYYALTKKPEVCVSFIKQFWRTAEILTDDDGTVKIHVTIDGHSLSITEGSLRRHLKLDDQDGITSLPTTEIFAQLALMGYATDSDKLTFQKDVHTPSALPSNSLSSPEPTPTQPSPTQPSPQPSSIQPSPTHLSPTQPLVVMRSTKRTVDGAIVKPTHPCVVLFKPDCTLGAFITAKRTLFGVTLNPTHPCEWPYGGGGVSVVGRGGDDGAVVMVELKVEMVGEAVPWLEEVDLRESQRIHEEKWEDLRRGAQRDLCLWLEMRSVLTVELVQVERVVERHLDLMVEPFSSRLEGITVDREEMRDEDSQSNMLGH
ncbi:hypothetical protein Tco_0555565 [Tanacetum coccineum]